MRKLTRLITWPGLLLAASGALVGCSVGTAEAQVIEDSFAANGTSRLMVTIDNGTIEVTSASASGDTIEVTATVRDPERVEYSAVQVADTVRIVAKADGGLDSAGGEGSADIVVAVPRKIDLELESSNGVIKVTSVDGAVSAKTSNGRINLSDVLGEVDVQTSNGAVKLAGVKGEVKAETSNGSISFSGTLPPGSENTLKTSNGSVEVSLIDTPGIELEATNSNGKVRSALPIAVSGEAKDNELIGTIGDGESRLEIQASNGSIDIKRWTPFLVPWN